MQFRRDFLLQGLCVRQRQLRCHVGGFKCLIWADPPQPTTPYAVSKWEAEQALVKVCGSSMEWVIVRPPLVYGPQARGNLAIFQRLAKLHIPLPLGHLNNQRSLISLDNLTSFLIHCCFNGPPRMTLLVADAKSLTTAEIYRMVCQQVSVSVSIFSLPKPLQSLMSAILKRLGACEKLAGSLEVDISDTVRTMSWHPDNDEITRQT